MMTTVALVDDHVLFRRGIAAVLADLGGYAVVIEAAHGRELIAALEDAPEPCIAIVDLNMPVMDGWSTLNWLREHRPAIRPLVLTHDAAESALVRAVHDGARGFLLKDAPPVLLKEALDSLMLTGYYYNDSMHEALLRTPASPPRNVQQREEVLERITPREREFLQLVCDPDELTYDQVARRMGIHRRTLDTFREALFEKFAIKSKTGLVLFAMRWRLVDDY
jgi:DNA-binding NarL/FixJ family response regulator